MKVSTHYLRSVVSKAGLGGSLVTPLPVETVKGVTKGQKTLYLTPVAINTPKRFYSAPVSVAQDSTDLTSPPDQSDYQKNLSTYNDQKSRNFAYFMVGTYSFVGAMAAKNLITDYLAHFSASADVLALAKVEVDMAAVPQGKNVIIKWRGKPVFVRHRTPDGMRSILRIRNPGSECCPSLGTP